MHRVIVGLRWARLSSRELILRPKNAAAKRGITFEKAVFRRIAAAYADAQRNVCIEFEDENGLGCAFPDIIVPSVRLVIECKLSDVIAGEAQLRELYLPLLQRCDSSWADAAAIVATKAWRANAGHKKTLASFREARAGMNYWIVG